MSNTKALWAGLIMAIVLLEIPPAATPASLPSPARPSGAPCPDLPGRTIVVTGRGTVEAQADQATVSLGYQTTRPTAQEAQEGASAVMNQIIRQILALGIRRDRIRTVTLSLFPEHRPPSGEITGYQAVQRIAVTVDDFTAVGRVIDAGVAAGANLVDAVSFGLRDASPYRARALAASIQDARTAASAAAAASGVTLLQIVRIEEVGPGPVVQPRIALQGTADTTTPVLPGMVSITVQVQAAFAF